jgi:hypothetical protein
MHIPRPLEVYLTDSPYSLRWRRRRRESERANSTEHRRKSRSRSSRTAGTES